MLKRFLAEDDTEGWLRLVIDKVPILFLLLIVEGLSALVQTAEELFRLLPGQEVAEDCRHAEVAI